MISKVLKYSRSIGILGSLLLFLYFNNVLNLGLYFGFLIVFWIILKMDFIKQNLDFDFLLLLIFSVSYGMFYSFNPVAGFQYTFVYILTPPFLYLVGKYLVQKTSSSKELFYMLLFLGVILSISPLISVLLDISQGGFVQSNRNIPMFWGGEPKNATGMAAPFVLNMCIPAILMVSFGKIKFSLKILFVIIFSLSVLCVLRLGSRTQIIIVLLTFLLTLKTAISKQSLKQNITLFAVLSIILLTIIKNVSFDLDSDWLTSFAGRMENNGAQDIASGGGRTDRWIRSLENLTKKPLGWDVKEFGYSHNLWLDVLRVGGILSFFLLVFYSLRSFFILRKAVKIDTKNISLNMLFTTYFLAFILLFMVEPIIDGSFYLFIVFCIFMGVLNKYKENSKRSVSLPPNQE